MFSKVLLTELLVNNLITSFNLVRKKRKTNELIKHYRKKSQNPLRLSGKNTPLKATLQTLIFEPSVRVGTNPRFSFPLGLHLESLENNTLLLPWFFQH